MTVRATLPQRRQSRVIDLRNAGVDYAITVGLYPDGKVGEVFISCHKAGSALASLARDAAVVISLALQHGATLEMLRSSVTREADGAPAGLAGAVLDAITAEEFA